MPRVEHHQVDLPPQSATSRRQLLSSLLAGGAFAVAAPMLAGRASAAEGATTTTAPPSRDPKDTAIINAALRRESQIVATYKIAVGVVSDKDDIAGLTLIHDHHVAYVQALKGFLGTEAEKPSTTPLASPSGSFNAIASQLAAIENATVDIHINSLSQIAGLDVTKLISSIITMEARHAAALAVVSGTAPLAAAGL
jgi:hypothetical protein